MRRGLIAVLALVSLAGVAGAQTSDTPSALLGDFEKRFAPSTENAAAEDVEDLARGLGIDARPGDADAQRPAPEDQESYQQAGIGQWLDSQIRSSDDAIAMPPASLRDSCASRAARDRSAAVLLGARPGADANSDAIPPLDTPDPGTYPAARMNVRSAWSWWWREATR